MKKLLLLVTIAFLILSDLAVAANKTSGKQQSSKAAQSISTEVKVS